MFFKRVTAGLLLTATVFLTACSQSDTSTQSNKPVDDKVMEVIATGIQKRSDVLDAAKKGNDTNDTATLKQAVQTEIDNSAYLNEAVYNDQQLKEKVQKYISLLNDSKDVLDKYSANSTEYQYQWAEIYKRRTALLKEFMDNYGLKFDDKHKDALTDLVAAGSENSIRVQVEDEIRKILTNADFKRTDNYGTEFVAIVENTTGHRLQNFTATFKEYDVDGVHLGDTYTSIELWEVGEKAKLTAYPDDDTVKLQWASFNYNLIN